MSKKHALSRNVVSRNVAIGLGVLCVILFLALVGVVSYYSPDHSRMISLQDQVDSLNRIVNLQKVTMWENETNVSQDAGAASAATYVADYAGYVLVNVKFSTTYNTSVKVTYVSHGVYYSGAISVGSAGTAVFPVLPGSITVMVGNTNVRESAVQRVTILYYY